MTRRIKADDEKDYCHRERILDFVHLRFDLRLGLPSDLCLLLLDRRDELTRRLRRRYRRMLSWRGEGRRRNVREMQQRREEERRRRIRRRKNG
eukprot:763908-Hanusia_phi.AAC.5